MRKSRREFGGVVACLAAGLTLTGQAAASTARALTLKQLAQASDRAVFGIPVQRECEWATVGGARRIVTRTRFLQEADFFKEVDEGDELEVLTLGGQVGEIGQVVSGEAALVPGERALLFVSRDHFPFRRVIGMAQGHYPVEQEPAPQEPAERGSQPARLVRSPHLPLLLPARRSSSGAPPLKFAVEELHHLSLALARTRIKNAR